MVKINWILIAERLSLEKMFFSSQKCITQMLWTIGNIYAFSSILWQLVWYNQTCINVDTTKFGNGSWIWKIFGWTHKPIFRKTKQGTRTPISSTNKSIRLKNYEKFFHCFDLNKQQSKQIKEEMENLAYKNYKSFIQTSNCVQHLHKQVHRLGTENSILLIVSLLDSLDFKS